MTAPRGQEPLTKSTSNGFGLCHAAGALRLISQQAVRQPQALGPHG